MLLFKFLKRNGGDRETERSIVTSESVRRRWVSKLYMRWRGGLNGGRRKY
jgi:hypothetical protein